MPDTREVGTVGALRLYDHGYSVLNVAYREGYPATGCFLTWQEVDQLLALLDGWVAEREASKAPAATSAPGAPPRIRKRVRG